MSQAAFVVAQAADLLALINSAVQKALARATDASQQLTPGDLMRLASTIRIMEALMKVCCPRCPHLPATGCSPTDHIPRQTTEINHHIDRLPRQTTISY